MTQIAFPDIGADSAQVASILVKVGDTIEEGQALVELESDKAAMEVPASASGTIKAIHVKVGDQVQSGAMLVDLESNQAAAPAKESSAKAPEAVSAPASAPAAASASQGTKEIAFPDIGADSAQVASILVKVGDTIEEGQALVELESDKAAMEVPASASGTIKAIHVKVGDQVQSSGALVSLEVASGAAASAPVASQATAPQAASPSAPSAPKASPAAAPSGAGGTASASVYAGPAARKAAREKGINLASVKSSGTSGRITLEDVLSHKASGSSAGVLAPSAPLPDFSAFGEVSPTPMSRIHEVTAEHMARAWLTVPHVTQHDEAEISSIEAFRASLAKEAEKRGVKMTLLPFVIKACIEALKAFPQVNASLDMDNKQMILKQYYHVGVAVDTPRGLMVPVIQDADQKDVFELAAEINSLAKAAIGGTLKPNQMQGGTFSISSLGSIGGTFFTPIVNFPEVAILGVGRAVKRPIFDSKGQVTAGQMLPLSLSYDHRAINGAMGARVLMVIKGLLEDPRRFSLSKY